MNSGIRLLFPAIAAILFLQPVAWGHCDSLGGPVILDAGLALEKGDVTPVLKWVRPGDEPEIRATFREAMAVRTKGPEARALADRHFFETVVRIHRAGEGAPYEGLKPADQLDASLEAADRALASGSAEKLVRELSQEIEAQLRKRLEALLRAKAKAHESVEAGRAYVRAYVEFMHSLERLTRETAAADQGSMATKHSH